MTDRKRELLRPEEATSFEEFQARSTTEQLLLRGSGGSWKTIGLSLLSGLIALAVIISWAVVAITPGTMRWAMVIIALIPTGLLAWVFGGVMRRAVGSTRRCYQLDRLGKEWQVRAERGEIPAATPGGPKVWRDDDRTVGA